VKTFVIGSGCNIRAHIHRPAPTAGLSFASEVELAALAAAWPGRHLLEIWNKLPDVVPVSKFKDRRTAIRRIWRAVQTLEASKAERIIDLLKHPAGASIETLMDMTGWQPHSVRAFISAQLAKRMRFRVKSFTRDGQRVYRIIPKTKETA